MRRWIFLVPALLLAVPLVRALRPPRAQASAGRWACVQQQLEGMGYRVVAMDSRGGTVRAEREVRSLGSLAGQAAAVTTRIATVGSLHPAVTARFDRLDVSGLREGPDGGLLVEPASMLARDGLQKRDWPRAQVLRDAQSLSVRCEGLRLP